MPSLVRRLVGAVVVGVLLGAVALAPTSPAVADTTETWVSTDAGLVSCGVTSAGTAYCWGESADGALGDGESVSTPVPRRVVAPPGSHVRWSQVVTGWWHTCGVTTDGDVHCWGSNSSGQLGDGSGEGESRDVPGPVALPAGVQVRELALGTSHSCALTTTHELYCWGYDSRGQLGDGLPFENRSTPVPVPAPSGADWASVAAGDWHTCATTDDGDAYCWGRNEDGQLGTGGTSTGEAGPVPVDTPVGVRWATLAAGSNQTCGLDVDGDLRCWGSRRTGQLGDGSAVGFAAFPVPVSAPADAPEGVTWAAVDAGTSHTCGLTSGGIAYCWGSDSRGRLGNGDETHDRYVPVRVDAPGVVWTGIGVGSFHSCGTTTEGEALCWGIDHAIGAGATVVGDAASPVRVAPADQVLGLDVPEPVRFGDTLVRPVVVDAGFAADVVDASGACAVEGSGVVTAGVGECVLRASEPGSLVRAAVGPVELRLDVARATSTTAVEVVPTPAGDPVELEVTVTGGAGVTPGGAVTVASGDVTAEVELDEGAGTVALALPAGTHRVEATYAGDDLHEPSVASVEVEAAPTGSDATPPGVPVPGGDVDPPADDPPGDGRRGGPGDTGSGADGAERAGPGGELARTGVVLGTTLGTALVLLGVGAALLRRPRRSA